ncbi:ABC transporter ATP-binding protein [Bacteroidia bacterium]|nr:ABC transporter ATP-binding protein [Bacteroidia bacterium]
MITVKNLCKAYNKKSVLKDLDLTIATGKIQAILGRNGAGKSTLVHCIANIINWDKGEVFINDTLVTQDEDYRKGVGYMFQDPIYIDRFSASEYLEFVGYLYSLPKSVIKQRIEFLLKLLDLPNDRKFIEYYSYGMKNKVSLAAALLHKPKYLILDEPLNGIDFLSCQRIIRELKTMANSGATILITSHQLELMTDTADLLGVLKDGYITFNTETYRLSEMAHREGISIANLIEQELH